VALKFLSPHQNQYVYGKITDISMGGVAVEFSNSYPQQIKTPDELRRTQLKLENNTIFADIKLVKYKDKAAAFQFAHLNEHAKDILAGYIYRKIQDQLSGI
jgi:c-di-GMP-binding flagellar brake protein YcgR